jgi:hypothetical protein
VGDSRDSGNEEGIIKDNTICRYEAGEVVVCQRKMDEGTTSRHRVDEDIKDRHREEEATRMEDRVTQTVEGAQATTPHHIPKIQAAVEGMGAEDMVVVTTATTSKERFNKSD